MTRKIVVSRDAEVDLILIWVYYAEKSALAAQRVREEIASKYDLLLQYPQLGRSRDEVRKGLRSFSIGNYVVFYREIDNGIQIVRVLHGAQDVSGVFLPPDEETPSV